MNYFRVGVQYLIWNLTVKYLFSYWNTFYVLSNCIVLTKRTHSNHKGNVLGLYGPGAFPSTLIQNFPIHKTIEAVDSLIFYAFLAKSFPNSGQIWVIENLFWLNIMSPFLSIVVFWLHAKNFKNLQYQFLEN